MKHVSDTCNKFLGHPHFLDVISKSMKDGSKSLMKGNKTKRYWGARDLIVFLRLLASDGNARIKGRIVSP